jgi:hypothetical protein
MEGDDATRCPYLLSLSHSGGLGVETHRSISLASPAMLALTTASAKRQRVVPDARGIVPPPSKEMSTLDSPADGPVLGLAAYSTGGR